MAKPSATLASCSHREQILSDHAGLSILSLSFSFLSFSFYTTLARIDRLLLAYL